MAARAAGRAAAEDYRANRYHQPSDEYDPNWDWSGAIRDLQIYYRIGRELADERRLAELVPKATNSAPSATDRRAGRRGDRDDRTPAARMGAARLGLDRLSEPCRPVGGRSRAGARGGRGLRPRGPCRRRGRGGAAGRRRSGVGARGRARSRRSPTIVAGAVRRHLAARHRPDHPQATAARGAPQLPLQRLGRQISSWRATTRSALRLAESAGPGRRAARLDPGRRRDRRRRHRPRRHHRAMPAQPQPQSGHDRERGRGAAARPISASTACSGSARACSTTIPTAMSTISPASSAEGRLAIPEPAGDDDPNAAVYARRARRAPRRSGSRSCPSPPPAASSATARSSPLPT